MNANDKLALAIGLAGIFFLAMLLFIKYARNTARNRAIERMLGDLSEYELESALVL